MSTSATTSPATASPETTGQPATSPAVTGPPDAATPGEHEPTIAEQSARLLTQVAGYVGHRTIALGLRTGMITALAESPAGLTPDELAQSLSLDPLYVMVWCRSAYACGLCDGGTDAEERLSAWHGRYRLAPQLATLLLDESHPAYAGGVFTVLEQHEVFDRFETVVHTGARLWWDDCSPAWIEGVAGTGAPFYTRLIPTGLAKVPGLPERLEQGCRVVDSACGSGVGLVRLAKAYPRCEIIGVDGDRRSLDLAARRLAEAGLLDRCTLVHSPLEEMVLDRPVTCMINNISMHECRDIDRVADRVRAALEPGGWFVISDFPFPDAAEALRSVPGRVMAGIQFFEAQIDDQLLPRAAYDDLLGRHGFVDVDHLDLAPVHAVTYGRTPVTAG